MTYTQASASSSVGPRSYREAVEELERAQKSGAGIPAYLRWVNRPLGRRLAAVAYVLRMTPNQVTLVSLASSVAAMLVLVLVDVTPITAVVAATFMVLGYALDSSDGQLARLVGSSGPSGEFLDHVADAFRQPFTHLAIAVALWGVLPTDLRWLAASGVLFATVASVWFFSQILAESLLPRSGPRPGSSAAPWVSVAKLPLDPGLLYLLLLTLPATLFFTTAYLGLLGITLGVATLSVWRKYQALSRI